MELHVMSKQISHFTWKSKTHNCYNELNGSQLAKMEKYIPGMSLP